MSWWCCVVPLQDCCFESDVFWDVCLITSNNMAQCVILLLTVTYWQFACFCTHKDHLWYVPWMKITSDSSNLSVTVHLFCTPQRATSASTMNKEKLLTVWFCRYFIICRKCRKFNKVLNPLFARICESTDYIKSMFTKYRNPVHSHHVHFHDHH